MPAFLNDPQILIVGEPVTVTFTDLTAPLTGTFQGFRNNFQFLIVQDAGDPSVEHLIQTFAYVTVGATP